MAVLLRRLFRCAFVCLIVFCAGEVAARLDDWAFAGLPFFANPNRERDLVVHDELGVRGRPAGSFKKWNLNSHGFRGPEIEMDKPIGIVRVMILGASETFGLYESEGKEYAAQLRDELRKAGRDDVEIVNAALAGISIKSMIPYWKKWASQFQPDYVLIYPSPLFYLDDELPKGPPDRPRPPEPVPFIRSRFWERLVDTIRQNEIVRAVRVRYVLTTKLAGKADGYVFKELPRDRLDAYLGDLETLLDAISATGATPILLTHAHKSADPPTPSDMGDLEAMRLFLMRAEPGVMTAFESAANSALRDLAKKRDLPLFDVDRRLTTERTLFADLVHFNNEGSGKMAELLATELRTLLPEKGPR